MPNPPATGLAAPPNAKPPAPSANPPALDETSLLNPLDVPRLRTRIYDHVFNSVKNTPPVENTRYRLRIENPRWNDPEDWGPAHQKKVFFQGGTLARRLQGDYILEDVPSGKEVSRKTATIMAVPHLNNRGLFLINGSHWTLSSQTRLDPGMYPRRQENGEIEAYINPKGGRQHRVALDPESGIFHMEMGQSRIPLMPILRSLGVEHKQLHDAWGHELVAKNSEKDDPAVVKKLLAKLYDSGKLPQGVPERKLLEDKFHAMQLDPYVTSQTVGTAHDRYDANAILNVTKHLLAINRGEKQESVRDHQAFQKILGQEHLFGERAKNTRPLLNQMLWKATHKGNLDHVPSGYFNQHMLETITGTGLGINAQMTNPAEMLDSLYRVTKMGSGGIKCYSADTEVYTDNGWKLWPEVTMEDCLATCIDGKLCFNKPEELFCGAYEGKMLRMTTKFVDMLVTPDHRHYVQSHGDKDWKAGWEFRLASDVHGKRIRLKSAVGAYEGGEDPEVFSIEPAPVLSNRASAITVAEDLPFDVWVDFMAAYLADGSFSYNPARGEYRFEIGKVEAANPSEKKQMEQILDRTGFTYRYDQGRRFVGNGKHIAYYLSQFGKSRDKFVPTAIMTSSLPSRKRFLDLITTFDCSGRWEGFRHYRSASKRLRDQVADLAISCGYSVRYGFHEFPNPVFSLKIIEKNYVGVTAQRNKDQYQEVDYCGNVYCARVAGGLLFVRRNGKCAWSGNSLESVPDASRNVQSSQFHFVDPVVTPESSKAGVDLRFASGTRRDNEGKLYARYTDPTGKSQWMTARDLQGKTIGSWEERNSSDGMVSAIQDGEMKMIPRNKVDFWSPPMEHAFSPAANLIPFKSASPPHRAAMGARMTTQALPLVGGESPHVQSGHPDGGSYEQRYGEHFGAIRAKQGGKVMAVTPDAIKVKYQDGTTEEVTLHKHELYDHAPGRKTHFTQSPVVKAGDFIQPGQLVARSNYTDDKGQVALGLNARTAWLPGRRGGTFEDAFAVSESFAQRMRSDHMALHSLEDRDATFGRSSFRSLFPAKYDPAHLKEMDDNGVIKPGAIVKPGQPLILGARQVTAPRTTLVRSPKPVWQDISEVWDHDYPGEVIDAVKTRDGYRVSVKSAVPMQDSDKISGRHGNKGIVTIVPDHEMPRGEDGKPFEVLISPYTLSSRGNDSQIAETLLAKVAAKTGKKYAIPDFNLQNLMQFANDEAKKNNVSPTETVHDPVTGVKIPGVLTGNQYFMKLHHLVESKIKHRDTGGYDSFDTPARGGSEGAKRMALSDTFALLAHNATSFLRGSKLVRGQRNEHFWEAVMSGYTPPTPGIPMQYRRFVEGLKASGIHPVTENGKMRLMALTDNAIDRLAGDRELKNAKGVDWAKGGDPIEGGLFDRKLHGEDGSRWSKLSLYEPMPNPAFEDPIRYTLGLTEKQMRNVVAGKGGFIAGKYAEPKLGEEMPRTYQTGPSALHEALKNIDIDKEIAKNEEDIRGTKKTRRDAAIRRQKYLQGAKDQGIHPSQWMMTKMPVLPPMFRPVSKMQGSNTEIASDPNYLYQDLFNANKNLQSLHGRVHDLSAERLAVYDAVKAVSGLGDPINPKTQQKGVKGMLKLLLADSPKWSIVQRNLLSSPVDLVGRSTVGPDANLDMDELGIPEAMAHKVYSRFTIKRLVQGGMSPSEAVRAVNEQTPEARKALLAEMAQRPVSYHRAPVLHKYGHIGAWPKLVKGDVIKVSPFVIKGLGMDFDGDTANIHVPVYPEEVKDVVEKMMPSKNLLSAKDFNVHYKPEREFHVGLWQATSPDQKPKEGRRERVFEDIQALKRAFANGEISVHDKVSVMKH
jgi:DNA-directed RNA polymerase beta subunit